jgi:signal transduction histidine kinase
MEGSLELANETGNTADFERCHQAVDQMRRLIENLLALAREGDIIASTAPVELEAAAESAWQTVATADATLSVDTDRVIEADRARVEQLLGNLYRNAVKHGGSTVTVSVGDAEDGFFVADDGSGISEEAREHVFDAGYSTASDGTGLGLDIVRQISEAHGWDVSVRDHSEAGAWFEITGVKRHD